MNLDKYNEQLKPCANCKTKQAKVEHNENAVGVMCNCGVGFTFENSKSSLKEIVKWWNKHYEMNEDF